MIYDDPVLGIDVSMHQPNIDWTEVRRHCDFAWIKTSEGYGYEDPSWLRHTRAAQASGILWGGYHFARANGPDWRADAIAEADWFVRSGGMDGSIPGALDMEHTDLDRDRTIAWAEAWCMRVRQARPRWDGARIPVYWGGWFAGSPAAMNDSRLHHCWWWMPGYGSRTQAQTVNPNPYGAHVGWSPSGTNGPRIPEGWQYTSNGRIPGYPGALDLNIAPRRTILELAQLAGPVAHPPVEETEMRTLLWAAPDSKYCTDVAKLDPAPAGSPLRHCFVQEGIALMYLGLDDPHGNNGVAHNPVIGTQQYFTRAQGREFLDVNDNLLFGYSLVPSSVQRPSFVAFGDGTRGRLADLFVDTEHQHKATSHMAFMVFSDWTFYVLTHDTTTDDGKAAVGLMKFLGASVVPELGENMWAHMRLTGDRELLVSMA